MQEVLTGKLYEYIKENNPDLLLTLQEESKVEVYLRDSIASIDGLIDWLISEEAPPFIIEEMCMEELTRPLRPSKFNYLNELLEEEFPDEFQRLSGSGLLISEVIKIVKMCEPVFLKLGFKEDTTDGSQIYYAITGIVSEYLKSGGHGI